MKQFLAFCLSLLMCAMSNAQDVADRLEEVKYNKPTSTSNDTLGKAVLAEPLDGSVDVTMGPGETKSRTNVRIGGYRPENSYFDEILEIPDFMSFRTDAVKKGVTAGTLVDFTLEAADNAPNGEFTIRVEYNFHFGGPVTTREVLTVNLRIAETPPAPTADFTGSPTSGTKPLTVQFTNTSSGQITSRSWNFGDGQTSTLTSPSHTYVNAGTYTVSLTVTGPGGSNTKSRTNYINVTEPAAPVADFTGSPTSGLKPLTVQFTNTSSGQITSRSWNFGDGQTSTATSPSHTYANAGTYTVSLTVTGPGGSNTKTRTNYITVNEPPPVADFTGSPTSGERPLTVQFTDASSGQITSRSWNFGDGQTSTATSPSHTYVNAGSYTVSLTVTGLGGSNTKTRENYITVQEPVLAGPRNLTAQSGAEESVPLSWESPEPAAPDTVELFYDDGSSEALIRGNFSGAELAVRFTPPSHPVSLITLGFLAQGDATNDVYGIKIYLDPAASNRGPVGSPVLSGQVSFSGSGFVVAKFPVPITIENGDFYIGLNYISGTSQDFAIGLDTSSDSLRSWLNSAGAFKLARDVSPSFAGNFVIRAVVVRPTSSAPMIVASSLLLGEHQMDMKELNISQRVGQIVPSQKGPDQVIFAPLNYSILSHDFLRYQGFSSTGRNHFLPSTAALLGFNIYRSTTSPVAVDAQHRIGNVEASVANYNDTDVTGGTTYYYVVTAVYDAGESEPSNEVSATPSARNNLPVVASAVPDTILRVGGAAFTRDLNAPPPTFTDPDGDALSYTVISSNPSVAGAVMSGSILTVSPVAVGRAIIMITADDGRGGTASTGFTVQVLPASPTVPALTMPANGAINQPISLTLSWNPSTGAEIYHLQVATVSDFVTTIVDDSTITTTSHQPGSLEHNTTHYWRVKAKNAGGTSSWSTVRNFTTIVQSPARVSLISPAHSALIGADSVQFIWRQSTPAISRYWFELATDSLMTNAVIDSSLAAADTTKTVRQFTDKQIYWWKVRAMNVAGWGPFSEQRKFSVLMTGVEIREDIPTEFRLSQNYPNPFNPGTTIEYTLPKPSHVELKIYDVLGNEVRTLVNGKQPAGKHRVQFDSRSLPAGVYFYRLQAEDKVETRKMIIAR